MAHTIRCLEFGGALESVVLPHFGAQKVFLGGKDVSVWAQIRRRMALVVQVAPYEQPAAQYWKTEAWGILRFFDASGASLTSYVGGTPKIFILPRQITSVSITTYSGGVAWLLDTKTLGSVPSD